MYMTIVLLFPCTEMERYIGLLKVAILKGTDIVASDFMNISDPYVVVSLGNQVSAVSHFAFASILNILHIFMV